MIYHYTLPYILQEQYLFVYDVLLEALICGDTTVPVQKYLDTLSDLLQYDESISKTKMDEQFEVKCLQIITVQIYSKLSLGSGLYFVVCLNKDGRSERENQNSFVKREFVYIF